VVGSCRLKLKDTADLIEGLQKEVESQRPLTWSGVDGLQTAVVREWRRIWMFEITHSLDGDVRLGLGKDNVIEVESQKLTQGMAVIRELMLAIKETRGQTLSFILNLVDKVNSILQCNLTVQKHTFPHHTQVDEKTGEDKNVFCCMCSGNQFSFFTGLSNTFERLSKKNQARPCDLVMSIYFANRLVFLKPRLDKRLGKVKLQNGQALLKAINLESKKSKLSVKNQF